MYRVIYQGMASSTDRQTNQTFIKSQGDFSVPDFCRMFRDHLPQVVSLKEDRKSKAKDVTKIQTYFVGKVCCEKKVTVDLVKKKKSRGTVLLPLSHPTRVCFAGTREESPAITIEEVLNNHTCPCDVIVAPHRHFRLQLKGKEVMTNDFVLRLQGTVDEFSLLGNPLTETNISDEEVSVLTGPRLQLVIGITGYPGDWSSFLSLVSSTLKSQGNSQGVSRSLRSYEDISPDSKDDEHLYEGLVKTKKRTCVYELTWESNTGASLSSEDGIKTSNPSVVDKAIENGTRNSAPKVSDVGVLTKNKCQTDTKEINSTDGKGGGSVCCRTGNQTGKPHISKVKATDRNHLYDVGWDPETQKPVILSRKDVNSSTACDTPTQNTEKNVIKGVAISELSSSEQQKQNGLQLPYDNNVPRYSPLPSLPPRIPKKYGILISDLPKPAPKQFLSLDRKETNKPRGYGGNKLNRSQSDMGFGELVNANNIHPPTGEGASSLSSMSVNDLVHWLNTLHIKCADKFIEHSIDGAKLLKSTEEIFQSPEIGMSKLDILRLKKFIKERCV